MPKQDYHDLLTPEVVDTVNGLMLLSKVLVEGYMSGLNRSVRVGSGMEFSQYRGYEPGDDLRLLDWKMLARSGRYYIKQSETESPVTIKFILDASASMDHTENGLSKIQFARTIIASLAYLAQKQGDAVGLYALSGKEYKSIFPTAHKKQYSRLLLELLQVDTHGKWPQYAVASQKAMARGTKELIFFITDMYEEHYELSAFVKQLKSPRNEVAVLHIMGKAEMDFDYGTTVTFEDLETGARVKVDTMKAKQAYLEQMKVKIKGIKETLLQKGIGYHRFQMDEPLETLLPWFLKERNRID